MGQAPSSCRLLGHASTWQPKVAALVAPSLFVAGEEEEVVLSTDNFVLILELLDLSSLAALACTCRVAHATGREISACFTEAQFRKMCHTSGWSFMPLIEVGVFIELGKLTRCPTWLTRISTRSSPSIMGQMSVVTKVLDACGPVAAPIDLDKLFTDPAFFRHTPRFRRLFFAHIKHLVAEGEGLISESDMQELRKIRGLQAYMYAEGWAPGGGPHMLDHAVEHALAGRIELS